MKTPKQRAVEYVAQNEYDNVNKLMERCFLAGYKDAQGRLYVSDPQEWISVKQRLPETSTRWFVVALLHAGGLMTIASSQFINGEWLQVRENEFVQITHWGEMSKRLP